MTKIEDIPLEDQEEAQIEKWEADGAHEAASRTALEYRRRRYMELFLERKNVRHSSRNCYEEGVNRYTRKDGLPITDEDIRAIDMCRYGQGHAIQGKAGDLEVFHHWYCDSGD